MKLTRQLVFVFGVTFLGFDFALARKRDGDRPVLKANEGDTLTLFCDKGAVTQETLYAVKWYKDEKEFFRNYPKADNPIKVYPIDGFTLEAPSDSPWQVVLKNVSASATGKYTCMVVDYPRYRTIYKSTQVEVISKNDTMHLSHQSDVPGRQGRNGGMSDTNISILVAVILVAICLALDLKYKIFSV